MGYVYTTCIYQVVQMVDFDGWSRLQICPPHIGPETKAKPQIGTVPIGILWILVIYQGLAASIFAGQNLAPVKIPTSKVI